MRFDVEALRTFLQPAPVQYLPRPVPLCASQDIMSNTAMSRVGNPFALAAAKVPFSKEVVKTVMPRANPIARKPEKFFRKKATQMSMSKMIMLTTSRNTAAGSMLEERLANDITRCRIRLGAQIYLPTTFCPSQSMPSQPQNVQIDLIHPR